MENQKRSRKSYVEIITKNRQNLTSDGAVYASISQANLFSFKMHAPDEGASNSPSEPDSDSLEGMLTMYTKLVEPHSNFIQLVR